MRVGLPGKELFREAGDDLRELAVDTFRNIMLQDTQVFHQSFSGVRKLLDKVSALEIPMGIASSKPHNLLEKIVADWPERIFFTTIQGIDNFAPKPDPTVVIKCMQNMGVKSALMIGDRIEDIAAGRSAGCLTLGVAQGAHSTGQLQEAGAHFVEPTVHEAYELIISTIKGYRRDSREVF